MNLLQYTYRTSAFITVALPAFGALCVLWNAFAGEWIAALCLFLAFTSIALAGLVAMAIMRGKRREALFVSAARQLLHNAGADGLPSNDAWDNFVFFAQRDWRGQSRIHAFHWKYTSIHYTFEP